MIKKSFVPSLKLIEELLTSTSFKAISEVSFLNKKRVIIRKIDRGLSLSFTLPFKQRFYYNDITSDSLDRIVLVSKTGKEYIIPNKKASLNSKHEKKSKKQFNDFKIEGYINQISTCELNNFENKFHRIIIPIPDQDFYFSDFQSQNYSFESSISRLIPIKINNLDFDFYTFKIDGKVYWGVDSLHKLEFEVFNSISFSIFLTYGFIKAELYLNEAYNFASDDIEFVQNLDMQYSVQRPSLVSPFGIFTTSPYSVLKPYFINYKIQDNQTLIDEWRNKIDTFKMQDFSNLVKKIYSSVPLQRAILTTLEANEIGPVELKATLYCVVFETICGEILKEYEAKFPKPVEVEKFSEQCLPVLEKCLNELNENKIINDLQLRILSSKIKGINQPTNKDKLSFPFKVLKYKLNTKEEKAIDTRNLFLHGSSPSKEVDEKSLFYIYGISLTLHRLIYILILRWTGFTGYIINYVKMNEALIGYNDENEIFIEILKPTDNT